EGGTPLARIEVPKISSAGRTTPDGGVVVAARFGVPTGEFQPRAPKGLLVRDPGGQFRGVPVPEEFLDEEEDLFEASFEGPTPNPGVKLAAAEEANGATGAFVVPDPTRGLNDTVIHYDGSEWSREPICLNAAPEPCEAPSTGFRVIAIEADGP